jgi:hypothetical protein
MGIAGAAIHLLELILHTLKGLGFLEAWLLVANLCLSVLVAGCSWSALRNAAALRSAKKPRSSA